MCSNETTPFMNNKRRLKASKSKTILPKKPKFLSLRHQFPPEETKKTRSLSHMRQSAAAAAAATATSSHQLNLFTLHPQNQVEHRDNQDHENVAYFFSTADGGATTLTGLLDNAIASYSSHNTNESCRQDDLSLSASPKHTYRTQGGEEPPALVHNARGRKRDSSEEKWVCYSEVLERKVKEEEVTSSVVDPLPAADDRAGIQRLLLKLDYEEILNAWSDKGPLYIHAETSQIVPNITYDFPSHEVSSNGVSRECNVGAWEVPEIENGETRLKMGRREASVLRYKAKREKRLFSKKIRYQVRKLNAEKRPRLKGRFVKRS